MTRREMDDSRLGCSRFGRVVSALMIGCLVVAGCSSSDSKTGGPSQDPASTGVSQPDVTLAAELPAKESVDALKNIFRAAGIDPEVEPEVRVQRIIPSCPLGRTDQLTAVPPAPVAGLDTRVISELGMSRDLIPIIECTFTNDVAGGVTSSTPQAQAHSTLQYQAAYVPGAQLQRYLTLLESEGYEKLPDTVVGGLVYQHCETPGDTATTVAGAQHACSAIWMNGVIEVGLSFQGPGDSVDVTGWLAHMVEPMVNSLAHANAALFAPTTAGTTP